MNERLAYFIHFPPQRKFDRSELISIIVGPKSPAELEAGLKQAASQFAPEVTIQRALLSQNGYGIMVPNDLVNVA